MEIQLHKNHKIERMVPIPFLYKARIRQKSSTSKVKATRSCMAKNVAMQGKPNFYEVLSLGSSEKVGFEEINKAYRAMALQYHPDVCPDPSAKEESTRRFMELREAYETLSDPVSRRNYDYELGLVDSLGFGGICGKERRFPKEVWERQLSGLRRRSGNWMERKKNGGM